LFVLKKTKWSEQAIRVVKLVKLVLWKGINGNGQIGSIITKPLVKMLWAICALRSTILVNFVLKCKTSR